jgi:hypothetical protein
MKIGIHQPYFFPYIGYFQLINAVDTYVCLDHVNFMKRSYMTRNSLVGDLSINIAVKNASQNTSCKKTEILADNKWFNTFTKTLEFTYKKEKNYDLILNQIINPWFEMIRLFQEYDNFLSIAFLNIESIDLICKYLDIKTDIKYTSDGLTTRKRNEGLQDIIKHYNGTEYINAIGGQALYTKKDFASKGIKLNFLKNKSNLPNTSILDILFRYDKELIKEELNNYELI